MKAIDILAQTGIDLVVSYSDTIKKVLVDFKSCYVKDGIALIAVCGRGETVDEAAEQYLSEIRNKHLVFDPFDKEKRREIKFYCLGG